MQGQEGVCFGYRALCGGSEAGRPEAGLLGCGAGCGEKAEVSLVVLVPRYIHWNQKWTAFMLSFHSLKVSVDLSREDYGALKILPANMPGHPAWEPP